MVTYTHTYHAHHYTQPSHIPHTPATIHATQLCMQTTQSIQALNMTNAVINATQPVSNEHSPNPTPPYGYTTLPLSDLAHTDLHLLSHNNNTLHTTTSAELGATFDSYTVF